MITISRQARRYIIQLLSKQKNETNIRIFINSPGTMHAECGLAYCDNQEIDDACDKKFSFNGFNIYVNRFLVPFLRNTEIDLIQNDLGIQITLKAPHAKSLKISRPVSQLERDIKNFLFVKVNPTLALHGGSVRLIKISSSKVVILQFLGGCNGCSMIDMTLKSGIEAKLMKYFPEITGVQDVTNHVSGQHSYY
ncbi:NfuA family Fe-S biogenesis protein [Buchnera aphidicola]|uniref:NfuA family Fe-S biogenesis protein n=1 Tax=Buchnera aphidicola TaxID=9 RepID=UPI00094C4C36|nr:NfuA family Fe-S biogenesis protein [Buchnera aphidicola]